MEQEMEQILLYYVSNGCDAEEVADVFGIAHAEDISGILGDFEREWNAAPCDCDGPTPEQDAFLNSIIDRCVQDIMNIKNRR